MFIKICTKKGWTLREVKSLSTVPVLELSAEATPQDAMRINIRTIHGEPDHIFLESDDLIYVMNSNGKTVETIMGKAVGIEQNQ